ncbi:hypothetical protein ABIF93_006094 [Bradyrhizobium japonicum]
MVSSRGIGEADDVCARSLGLKQEGSIVGRSQRMPHAAEHLAAGRFHGLRGLLLQIVTERVVGGDEEPLLAALLHDRLAEAAPVGIGVVGPVHGVGRAFFAGQQHRAGARSDEDLVLLGAHAGDSERDRGVGDVEDRVHAVILVPAPGDADPDVGLVLVIRRDDLDGPAGGLSAIVFDRHFCGDDRADTLIARERTGLVVQDADLHGILGKARRGNQHRSQNAQFVQEFAVHCVPAMGGLGAAK